MKKFISLFFLFFPIAALAVGGGGGGSIPDCTQDTWICSGWTECSADGTQKRTCSISFDCPGADSPRPTDTQTCKPPCTEDVWKCDDWSACSSDGKQTRVCALIEDCSKVSNASPISARECEPEAAPEAPKRNPFEPAKKITPEPTAAPEKKVICKEDRWDCGPWSDACDIYGNQKRTCKITLDCTGVETPPPQFYKRCEKLQCGNFESIKNRVLCRLSLTPAGLAREYEIEYLPEECRALADDAQKKECKKLYLSYKPCWQKRAGEERSICAKGVLGIGQSVAGEIKACTNLPEIEREECKSNVRQKIRELIKFRFYNLEERAEDLIEQGADKELIADFVVFITQKKDRFNKAVTNEEQKQIILEVRKGWKEFLKNVKIKMQKSK